MAAVYSVVVGVAIHREVSLPELPAVLVHAARLSSVVMIVVACASVFAWVLTTQGIASAAGSLVADLAGSSPWLALALANVILLACGLVLDAVSIYLVIVPLLLPAVREIGIDPVHFGLVATVNLAVGQVTPPVGVNLMVASAISDVPLARIARAALPLLAAEILALALVTGLPGLSTWLPSLMR